MKTVAILAATATLALSLAACDSQAENEVEEVATAIDERAEAEADIVEATEAGGPNEEAAEARADQIRAEGEETKDHLEDEADTMDSTPQ
jgi:hypothetical protein